MDARQERGMVIAATKKIVNRDGAWIVPPQTSNARYTVIHHKENAYCTCLDHKASRTRTSPSSRSGRCLFLH
jgi:hypothetical protein